MGQCSIMILLTFGFYKTVRLEQLGDYHVPEGRCGRRDLRAQLMAENEGRKDNQSERNSRQSARVVCGCAWDLQIPLDKQETERRKTPLHQTIARANKN